MKFDLLAFDELYTRIECHCHEEDCCKAMYLKMINELFDSVEDEISRPKSDDSYADESKSPNQKYRSLHSNV
jgi:hypothetical protein